jgi:hypothetical protein
MENCWAIKMSLFGRRRAWEQFSSNLSKLKKEKAEGGEDEKAESTF